MLSQLFMAKSPTGNFQRKIEMITDNLANLQTPGHKRREMHMESLFPLVLEKTLTDIQDPTIPLDVKKRAYFEYGTGIAIADINTDFSQGVLETTNRELDLAIKGKGFFQFRLADGALAYGRAGNLHLSPERDITDPNGHPLDPPIRIPDEAIEIIVNPAGQVYIKVKSDVRPRQIGQIILASVPRPNYLSSLGQNLFSATPESGELTTNNPTENGFGSISQKSLEVSNVNIVEEMMNMMMAQRAFSLDKSQIDTGNDLYKMSLDVLKG
jgi:flagellar basal-body rod protein FlgG